MRGKLICTTLKALEHATEGYTAYGTITRLLFCKRRRTLKWKEISKQEKYKWGRNEEILLASPGKTCNLRGITTVMSALSNHHVIFFLSRQN